MKVSALKKNVKAGFTLIELMVVIAILAAVAAIGYPAYMSHMKDGDRQVAQENLGSIHKILTAFKQEYKAYPCDGTAASILEAEQDKPADQQYDFGPLQGNFSNDYFRQVYFQRDNQSEEPFYASIAVANKTTKECDKKLAPGKALSRGENGMAYVLAKGEEEGSKESVNNAEAPLVICGIYPEKNPYSGEKLTFDMASFDGQALVLFGNGSVKNLKKNLVEDENNEAKGRLKDGFNLFPETKGGKDTSDRYWVLSPDL